MAYLNTIGARFGRQGTRPTWRWCGQAAALAAAYALSGWLGMLLAIPPGYVTAIFPASGVALGALLIGRVNLFPGVWLGSFLLNAAIAFQAPGGLTIQAAQVAALIGAGAALQGVAGALLVRRLIPDYGLLDDSIDILRFLIIGGPVACVISPAVGVATLWSMGSIAAASVPYSAWTWWVGDAIGVIIVTPLTLLALRSREALWRQRSITLFVATTVTLIVVIGAFLATNRWERSRLGAQFRETVIAMDDGLKDRLHDYFQAIASLRRFAAITPQMSRVSFALFVEDQLTDLPGIQALEWVPRVALADRERFEEAARTDGFADFRFTERDEAGRMVPAGIRDEYFPVFFIEPYVGNEAALGFDLGSNDARRMAMETARDTESMAATEPITLVQDDVHGAGFVVFDAVFDTLSLSMTPAASKFLMPATKQKALKGFILGVFRVNGIVETALSGFGQNEIMVEIDDVTARSEPVTLYRSAEHLAAMSTDLTFETEIKVANRQWQARFIALPKYIEAARSLQGWLVLVGGILFTGVLQAHLLVITGQNNRTQRRVEERTAEIQREIAERGRAEASLRASEKRIQGIVNTVVDGIITIDETGTIETVNPAAERIFGWQAAELIGQNIKKLMPDPYRSAHDGYLKAYLETNRAKIIGIGREVMGLRKDGSSFPIDLAVSKFYLDDRHTFVGVLRDISERKTAENELYEVNQQLTGSVAALEKRDRELTLLSRLNEVLMTCRDRDEAFEVIRIKAAEIFGDLSGSLSIQTADGTGLSTVVRWGNSTWVRDSFRLDECWALRQGHHHRFSNPAADLVCQHFFERPETGYICLPLATEGRTLGLLTVETGPDEEDRHDSLMNLVMAVGQTVKLALSNLMLSDALREQALRDPLTKLYNRRFMEEALNHEIARALRNSTRLVLALLDIDHFKKVNDRFGHEAGDYVLRTTADVLTGSLRLSDIVCRFGGEEFVVIMIDTDINGAKRRIDQIRERLKATALKVDGEELGPVTLSAGLVNLNHSEPTTDALLRAADAALYEAKNTGRDRVVVAAAPSPKGAKSVRRTA